MGGGSSKQESTSTTTTETNNASLQDTNGFAAGSVKATNIEILDGNAIESSFDFAKETQAHFGQTFESVLGLVEKSVDAQGEIVGQYAEARANEDSGGISKSLTPIVFLSIAGFITYKVMK